MKTTNFTRLMALGSLAAGLAGCLGEASTIDRTQPNALDKAMFEGIWYYRAAVVDADRESGAVDGITGNMDKIRWQIRQDRLVGYRTYEFIPYGEGLTDEGRDFFGTPVVAYAILSHFDIQREYNSATGVESNVIVENTTDRPWYQRQYIRVDWTNNIVGRETKLWTGWTNYPDAFFSGGNVGAYYQQGHVETDVHRPLITEDYFDITNIFKVEPSPQYCWMMLLFNGDARCGTGDVKVRLSFRKVDPNDDYESLYYPDELELQDDSGNAIVLNGSGRTCGPNRDPGECSVRTFEMDARFGNFRILRSAFDREREFTRTGRIYLAGRFDLWEDSFANDGSRIPFENRTAKPVVYWANVGTPEDIHPVAERIAADWTVPFDETVAYLKNYVDAEGRPDVARVRAELATKGGQMFQIRRNACNPEGIVQYARTNGLLEVVERVAGSPDRVTRGNVEQVCAAVQFAEVQAGKTLDPKVAARTGQALAFTWQRKGDLRYNINNYVEQVQNGPWGVAQFGQDPETGEFVGNQANYFGDAGDTIAQRAVDQVQWLNGDLSQEELFRGDLTRNTVVSRRSLSSASIRSAVRDMWMRHEEGIIDSVDSTPRGGSTGNETDDDRFRQMWAGTDIERDYLLTDDILRGFAGPTLYQPFDRGASGSPILGDAGLTPGAVSPEALAAASPANWGMTMETSRYNQAVQELGRRAWDMADFFDPNTSGLAEAVKGWDRDRIWNFLRRELYLAVQGHELGHTIGLRHNFQGSMDAINYRPEFWGAPDARGTAVQYWNNPPTAENPNRGSEYKYSTIMDYGFGVANQGWHGIGNYDKAAVRFMYGQLMEVWDTNQVSIPDARRYGSFARRCGHDDGFVDIDGMLFWTTPEWYPRILGSNPVDRAPCANDVDVNRDCDSSFDAIVREVVIRSEARAASNGLRSDCQVNVDDLNFSIDRVDDTLQPRPERINGARKMVRVADFLTQRQELLTNFPEYDLPHTAGVDESRDGIDDDEDGVEDDKGFDYDQVMHPVRYLYCSDEYAGFGIPDCQRWDWGWDYTEQIQNLTNRFDSEYVFANFRRDALSGWGSPWAYMSRLQTRTFFHMTNVYRYYLFTRQSAFRAPRWEDFAEASYEGVNFLERIIQTPEPGTYCLGPDNVYRLQTDSGQSCNQPYTVGIGAGEGRYLDSSWTSEYFYKANRIGDFYTKLAAIQQLTTSSGRFVRDLSDLFDRRAFQLGYLRVFDDPLLQRFAALVSGDHTGYRSRVIPDESGGRMVRYMPFFDEEETVTNAEGQREVRSVRQFLERDENRDGVQDFPEIEPAWSWTLQYYSMAWALANWSSVNDYAPEYYRMAKIAIEGTPEDIEYPSSVRVQTFTDPESSITYRAPIIRPQAGGSILNREFPAYYGDPTMIRSGRFRNWSAGSNVLAEADAFVRNEYTPAKEACESSNDSAACARFRRARSGLHERIGFIDRVRKFTRRAELAFEL